MSDKCRFSPEISGRLTCERHGFFGTPAFCTIAAAALQARAEDAEHYWKSASAELVAAKARVLELEAKLAERK